MNNFENYDLSKWQEGGLTVHPRPSARAKVTRQERRFSVASIFVPLVAVGSMLTMENVCPSNFEYADGSNSPSQFRSQDPASRNASIYWLGTVKHAADPLTPVASFEANALELARQIRSGALSNLSDETLRLAKAVHDPARMGASDDRKWIDIIAHAVAGLND